MPAKPKAAARGAARAPGGDGGDDAATTTLNADRHVPFSVSSGLPCACTACFRKQTPPKKDEEAERTMAIKDILCDFYLNHCSDDVVIEMLADAEATMLWSRCVKNEWRELDKWFKGLLERGGDCKLFCKDIASEMVIFAAQTGSVELLRVLRFNRADLETTCTDRKCTALMHAAHYGHVNIIKELVGCEVNTEQRDVNGYTALMIAVNSDRPAVVEALLKGNASVETTLPESQFTPLHLATVNSCVDIIGLLLAYGADLQAKDSKGLTAVDCANKMGAKPQVMQALKMVHDKSRIQKVQPQRKAGAPNRAANQRMDKEDMRRREAEAAEKAAELLKELELEDAQKVAKTKKNKKKKDGKGKDVAAIDAGQDQAGTSKAVNVAQPVPQDTTVTDKADTSKPAPALLPTPSRGPAISTETHSTSKAQDPVEQLRQEWEKLLEEASNCKDETRQPVLLNRARQLLPKCSDASISVKYGRKVMQRLEGVGPARAALETALAAAPPSRVDLQAALTLAKPVRCVLDNNLLNRADTLLEQLAKEEEEHHWSNLQSKLSWREKAASTTAAGAAVCAFHPLWQVPQLTSRNPTCSVQLDCALHAG
uniref:Uncharacterized protein n=1 Tax=Chlamydomonas euryale TaxID=1486919 RepID=A0A7R9V4H4_9CHLO|mmetsp:Transcript_1515/g.4073  ORF Transcript_1515/g.4073 Transcript_1515/m.4073 type:complete len:598 (+) Transcript_1515:83-1876(+)